MEHSRKEVALGKKIWKMLYNHGFQTVEEIEPTVWDIMSACKRLYQDAKA